MFDIIKNDTDIMKAMADDIFGKETTLSTDEKMTLVRIFLNHPELMEKGIKPKSQR
jgi:hypothetical protein